MEARTSLKILIIEDNHDFAFLFGSLLESMGHQCVQACDGIAGVDKAKQMRPDVVFCDIGLPKMNGFEVAKALSAHESLKDAVIVALTGYACPRDLDQAAESGFHYHMVKPVGMADLKQLLNKIQACDVSGKNKMLG